MEFSLENESATTSDSEYESKYNYRQLKSKLKAVVKQKIKRRKSNSEDPFEMEVNDKLASLNNLFMELSKETAKLQQEISLYRDLPYVKVRSAYTANAPPTLHMGNYIKTFSNGEKSVNVPTNNVTEASELNEILKDNVIFEEAVSGNNLTS